MSKRPTILSIYRLLPQTNCGECGEATCMSFASKLLERRVKVEDCKPLLKPEYRERFEKLVELTTPPIREVVIGVGDRAVKVGGEEVMYRHELAYHNPTAIAIDLSDTLTDEEVLRRCRAIEDMRVVRIGETLTLNLIAIRCASNSPQRFAEVASLVVKHSGLPIILCSLNPTILQTALKVEHVAKARPLLYAATRENWRAIADLAKHYECPVVVYEPHSLSTLKSLTTTLTTMGINDIIIDPGSQTDGLAESLNRMVMLRRAAVKGGDRAVGYPLLAIPATAWLSSTRSPDECSWREAYMAAIYITRFADLIILHTLEPWALLPILTLRQSIYSSPRKPVAIEPGLKVFGEPDEYSPVLITTNFALTYYTVANDLTSSNTTCYLLILNTEGLSVECAVVGGKFTAEGVKELIKSTGIEGRVKHRILIIPQLAARLKGEIEEAVDWRVIVGPKDSSEIPGFLAKQWPPKPEE